MEDVFEVSVNVTDFTSYELKEIKIAINQRGCIYPSITIEEEGKVSCVTSGVPHFYIYIFQF